MFVNANSEEWFAVVAVFHIGPDSNESLHVYVILTFDITPFRILYLCILHCFFLYLDFLTNPTFLSTGFV